MVLDEACVFVEDSSQQFQNTVSSLGSEGKKCLRCLCWFSKTTEPHLTTERAVQIPKYGQIRTESRLIRSLSPASDVPVLLLNQPNINKKRDLTHVKFEHRAGKSCALTSPQSAHAAFKEKKQRHVSTKSIGEKHQHTQFLKHRSIKSFTYTLLQCL